MHSQPRKLPDLMATWQNPYHINYEQRLYIGYYETDNFSFSWLVAIEGTIENNCIYLLYQAYD